MRRLIAVIKASAVLYFFLTTAIILFMSLTARFADVDAVIYQRDMYRILIVTFISILPSVIFTWLNLWEWAVGWYKVMVVHICHVTITGAGVFGVLTFFGWVDVTNALRVFSVFMTVYIISVIVSVLRANSLSRRLNERLDAFHKTENATHD